MIATDSMLLTRILAAGDGASVEATAAVRGRDVNGTCAASGPEETRPQGTSLALTCAQRLSHFTRYSFDPRSDESWQVADRLWRATRMAMDAERSQFTPRNGDDWNTCGNCSRPVDCHAQRADGTLYCEARS